MSRTSLALSNLRAIVIVIVLAFHSVLAYLASLPAKPFAFDVPPYRWQASPIIDSQRWFGFDLFCAWQDVSLMSLMFFLSGVFVPGSLSRKGGWSFLSDRLLRIGLPLVVVVVVVMPVAYYPAYVVTAADPSVAAFWQHWSALPFWPCGPQWFLCQLLALNALAAVLHRYAPDLTARLGQLASTAQAHPVRFFAGLVAVSAVVYVPLALVYTPWAWVNTGPFSFQISRPLHYLVYFFAGYAIGAYGLERGLLSAEGPLARHWAAWLAAAFGGFILWASADLAHARRPRGAPGRACRGSAGIHHRLRRRLLQLPSDLPPLCHPASLGARQPLGPSLQHVPQSLCLHGLAAICGA